MLPYLDGAFERVYRPGGTRYLNDHTLLRGPDGRWHVYGITHESAGMPDAERSLLHATAPDLRGPWRDEPDILMSTGDEGALWAPYAFATGEGRWAMLFYANTPDRRLRRADSTDLSRWTRAAESVPGGRDPFVFRVAGVWHLYSVGIDARGHGEIVVSRSVDLARWSEPATALRDPELHLGWGNLESPTVVARDGAFYLFLTRTTAAPGDYVRTMAFRSADPSRFTWAPITELIAHAAEVFEADGQGYITAAGWPSLIGEGARGLSITRLGWARASAGR